MLTVHCYISVAEKHKTKLRFMTENNKYKQIIEFNTITAIEYSSCYNSFFMSAKTKADDIFNKMYAYQWRKDSVEYRNAKQCALIAIQLVIEAVDGMVNEDSGYECKSYYEEVRDEITKL